MAVISRDAGLGSTTAFVHYENKEALFFAAVDDDLSAMFREFSDYLGVLMALDAELLSQEQEMVLQCVRGTVLDIIDCLPLALQVLASLEPHST